MQTIRQLKRRVSLQYQAAPLLSVLLDLAERADLKLDLEPGVLSLVPAETCDHFTILMGDATIDQALDAISGSTGLEFVAGDLAIQVRAGAALTASATQPTTRPRAPFIVTMPVEGPDGASFTVFFRPEDLPPELTEKIEARKAEVIQKLQELYPSTQPATAPAEPETPTE
jgi:hypothetical protein